MPKPRDPFRPVDLTGDIGGLSSYDPVTQGRPGEQIRGLISLLTGGIEDKPRRENIRDALGGMANLSQIPWLSDIAYDAVQGATNPKTRGRNAENLMWAAPGLIPGVGGKAKLAKGMLAKGAAKAPAIIKRVSKSTDAKDLFDLSRMDKIPKVKQQPLERYDPKRGTTDRMKDLVANKDVRDKMIEGVRKGEKMGGKVWYNSQPLRGRMVETLGPEVGDQSHKLFTDMMGAVSPRSKMPENVRNATFYHGKAMRGEPMPEIGDVNPEPYGHLAQKLHQRNAQKIVKGEWDMRKNPKPPSFSANIYGNYTPVAFDAHAFKAPAILSQDPRFLSSAFKVDPEAESVNIRELVESGKMNMSDVRPAMWESKPRDNEYKAGEDYYTSIANEVGMAPAQAQAAGWQGHGGITGLQSDETKSFMDFVRDRVMHTARETGKDPWDVLQDFITAKSSLKSIGGAGILGMLGLDAASDDKQQK